MISERTTSLLAGIRAEFPFLIGVFPFGMIYGALALTAGLSPSTALAMSSVLFAGSAQFITAQLIHDSAPAAIIILSIAVVNLRHVLYSASVSPYLNQLSFRWRCLLAYLLTDEAYAATIFHYEKEGAAPAAHWFFLGAGSSLWLTWQISTALGIMLGTTIPALWPLDFALPLTFIAMLVPMIRDRTTLAAVLSAGLVAVVAHALPLKIGLILAALVGISVGILLERRK